MISKESLTAFLNRKVDSFDWLKNCSKADLETTLGLGIDRCKLWKHQLVALLIVEELGRFLPFIDMGGGKSLLSLTLLQRMKQRGEHCRAIVFVPYITSVETWVEECAKHTPDLRLVPLVSSTQVNQSIMAECSENVPDLYVICYQSAVAMLAQKTKGEGWKLAAADVRKAFAGFNVMICDEIHRTKSSSSLTFRMCRALSSQCDYVMGLTGTPHGKDPQDLWAQFYLVDFGETLGDTLGFYRNVFFNIKPKYWGGYEYQFKQRLLPDLRRIIKHRSIHYSIDEFIDMPERVYVPPIRLRAPEASQGYIENAIEQINSGVKHQKYRLVESNYLQLRQLSSGFMTLKGEDSQRAQIKFEENPKLDVLVDLIESMPADCKMIVFHHFVYTNELISERLKTLKIKHARVWGKGKDNINQLRKFKTDPTCRVLVINSKSGSSSLNLQIANYVVFFEQPDSPIDRQQGERRTWRPGQTKRVLYYDLFVHNTVDEKMHNANKAGETLLKALLRGDAKLTLTKR